MTDLEHYADKYRPAATLQPKLDRRDLHQPFFPQEVFEAYFDSMKRRKGRIVEPRATLFSSPFVVEKKAVKRINLDDLEDNAEEEVVCTFQSLHRPHLPTIVAFWPHRINRRHRMPVHR